MTDLTPIGRDGFGAPLYQHQVADLITERAAESATAIINARDCELAGFDLADVLEAAKTAAP